jgi:sn-glycerol 3-phosphate transport system substrate-binding protein
MALYERVPVADDRAMRSRHRFAALLVALALAAAACGGGDDDDSATPSGAGGDAPASVCPVDAIDAAGVQKPVPITFWYQAQGSAQQSVADLIRDFNASQSDVEVTGSLVPTYPELFLKWRAGLGGGALPDLIQLEETTVQSMVDSHSSVPVGACVEADGYDTSDFLPRAIEYYTLDGQLQAMPWNVSNPVLYYNRAAFRDAGLDPDKPPTTFAEVEAYSKQIVDRGVATHGIALKVLPYYVEFWLAKAGQTYVDHDNGRDGRATAATLDNATGRAIYTWWNDMVKTGLALDVGPGTDPDHLFAIGNKNAAMTIEASGVIGAVLSVLSGGQYPGVEIGVARLPGVKAGGGVPVGDGALWLSAKSTATRTAAAWRFVKWLDEPAQQARLHVEAGYVPIRKSAIDDPAVKKLWADQPMYRVAYDQLEAGEASPAASGSVIGDYQGVRDAVVDSIVRMLTKGLSPAEAVKDAQRVATERIQAYNARVGG